MAHELEAAIVRDPGIMFGKPTVKGTRITVESILRMTGEGLSVSQILEEYPHLTEDGVKAALLYAADHLRDAYGFSVEAAEQVHWLADECIGHALVEHLRSQGEDVAWIREISPGIRDEEVLKLAATEKRILISEDFGFGNLVFAKAQQAFGIVIVQMAQFSGSRQEIAEQVAERLVGVGQALQGNLTVMGTRRFKPRPLPDRQGD